MPARMPGAFQLRGLRGLTVLLAPMDVLLCELRCYEQALRAGVHACPSSLPHDSARWATRPRTARSYSPDEGHPCSEASALA